MIFCLFLFPLDDVQDQREISTGNLKMFETVYSCENCSEIFTSESFLRLHRRSLHESLYDDSADEFDDDDDNKMLKLKHPVKFTNSLDNQAKIMPTKKHDSRYQTSTRCTRNKEDFSCSVCNQVFNNKRALEDHVDYEHETVGLSPKKYRCSKCPSSFKYQKNIQKHSNSKHPVLKSENFLKPVSDSSIEERGNFLCNYCDRSYSHQATLKEHIDLNHRSRRQQRLWKCENCDISYNIRRNLDRHRRNKCNKRFFKETQNHLSCNFCKQVFHHKRTLDCHVDYVHESEKLITEKYRCSECPSSFKYQNNIQKHINSMHNILKSKSDSRIDERQIKRESTQHKISLNLKRNLDRHQDQKCHASLEKKQKDVGRRSTRIRSARTKFEP